MAQVPAGDGTTGHEDGGRTTAWPGEQAGPTRRRRRTLHPPKRWRRPAAAASLLVIALATGLLLAVGRVPLADLATQVLAELIVVAGAAAVAATIRAR